MSTRFTIWCETCDVHGPHIRRHHSRAIFMEQGSARFFPVSVEEDAELEWGSFLIEHEYHTLLLKTEFNPNAKPPPEPPGPTHELMADGSLRPL